MKKLSIGVVPALALLLPLAAEAAPPDRVAQGDVHVGPGEQVGDAVSFGGDVTVSGWVAGDAVAMGGSVRLLPGARVDGDATALGGAVTVEPGAVANGDRVAFGGGHGFAASRRGPAPEGVGVPAAGPVRPHVERSFPGLGRVAERAVHTLGLYLLLVLLGGIMLGVAPQRTRALAAAVAAYPARSLGLGLLVVVATVAAIVVLCVTVVGIPVAAVLAALAGCAAILGLTGVAILLGELVPSARLKDRPFAKLLVGAGILVAALALPFAGPVIGALATVLGLGALAVTRMRPGHAVFSTGSGPYRSSPAP